MRRALLPLFVIAVAVLVFAAWMHPAVLWPTNIGWLLTGDDRGLNAIGLAAWLHAGGPGLRIPLLMAPEGLTLLFTDSVPLLSIVLGPVAAWLPREAQYVGAWYLLCVVSQASFAALLIRRYTAEVAAILCAMALLTAFPVLLNRYGHPSLCAQWLLLWALWIYVEPRRARRPLRWAVILAVAALVHSYLLLMVAAFWGSALFEQVARGPRRGRVMVGAVLAGLPAGLLLALDGAFGGPYSSTHTYGQFPAALDAWWNPANPGYTAFPISSPAGPNGAGFEGFNYLGLGLLALLLLAVWQVTTGRLDPDRRTMLGRLLWLGPAFGILALLAMGPMPVWRGQVFGGVQLAPALVDALDAVRASGRLLWPLTYTLAFAAIACATGWRRSALVLGSALALQVADLTPMLAAVRSTSAAADDPRVFTRTRDQRWAALIGNAGSVQFEPAEPFRDLALMEEVAWRAVSACRPLRYIYASRESRATRVRLDADARAFRTGQLEPTRLYILLGDLPAPPAVAARVRVLDGVRLVPPSQSAAPVSCASTAR